MKPEFLKDCVMQCTTEDGYKILINPSYIVSIKESENRTIVNTLDCKFIHIRESFDEIVSLYAKTID